ncbi:MAG: response regulator transcription factor [Chitinophagaceae bacterium]|nr:MAG: response regulator transcription factor [Chitinophagaceae bacterium]
MLYLQHGTVTTNMKPITVLLTDDHRIFREGLKSLLRKSRADDIEVIAEADNGLSSIEKAIILDPDIVLMDIQMPSMDGIAATREYQRRRLRAGIIGLSTFNDMLLIQQMLTAGAKGYLLKNAPTEEILRAIRTVYSGGMHVAPDNFVHNQPGTSTLSNRLANPKSALLTPREKEIIRLLCMELSSKEIASRLKIGIRSVDTHKEHIMKKLQVKNAVGIAVYALQNGLA